MNIQDYLFAPPYRAAWRILDAAGKTSRSVFYCTDPLDYVMWEPIQKHLGAIPIYASSGKAARYLAERNVAHTRRVPFPRAVVMARSSWRNISTAS